MTDEVRIVIDGGYDETFFCNDFNITTLEEAESALDNIDQLWKQKLEENPHWAGHEAWFRGLADSTVEKFKSGEFPLPSSTNANGNTVGRIVGQPPASEKSAEEANPPVKPETKGEEEEGSGWLDGLQLGLDAAGIAPGLGIFPDLLNAGISLCRGNYMEAGFSLFAAIPVVGDVAGAGKVAYKVGKEVAEEVAEKTTKEIAEKVAKEAAERAEKEAAEKAEREAAERAQKEEAEQGGRSKGKDKDGPCLIGSYGGPLKLICPPGSDAHHIVPDYTLRYGTRKEARVNLKRISKNLPTLNEGMCICLSKTENKKTGRKEHTDAHDVDPRIAAAGALSTVPGTIKLSEVIAMSIAATAKVKPECLKQITAVVIAEFAGVDGDTLLRSTYKLPKPGVITVLGTIER